MAPSMLGSISRRRNLSVDRISAFRRFAGIRPAGVDTFQPDLPPVGIDASRAEQTAIRCTGLANDRIQDDAGALHLLHLSRFLVDDFGHAFQNLIRPPAVWNQFSVNIKPRFMFD